MESEDHLEVVEVKQTCSNRHQVLLGNCILRGTAFDSKFVAGGFIDRELHCLKV
jgi:hypothetical protein